MVEATAAAADHVEQNNDMGKKSKNPLKNRHPIEWRRVIDKLPRKIQSNIARIIWWDWFADREVQHRWAHLDTFLSEPMVDLNKVQTIKYLMQCGYTEQAANKRITDANGRK